MQRSFVLGLIAVALLLMALPASATPPSGVASGPILARGTTTETFVVGTPQTTTVTRAVKIRIKGKTYTRRVKFQVQTVKPVITCGPPAAACDTAFQQVTINPGGSTGWHTHPGATLVSVAQGEGTLYHAGGTGCTGDKHPINTGFFQTEADNHVLRNEGTSPLVVYALYLLPSGTPNTGIRTDQPQPANCPSIP